MPDTFRALIAEGDSKQYSVDFKDIPNDSLPAGEVLIQAMYSSLNYKDGPAITRRGKVIRKFPMVLGVDLAGKVLESKTGEFKAGDEVLATGQSQLARLLADSLVHLPAGISAMQAMAVGTAGFPREGDISGLRVQQPGPMEKERLVCRYGVSLPASDDADRGAAQRDVGADDQWTLTPDDQALVMNKHRAKRLGFAILLTFFRDRGRFPRHESEVEQQGIAALSRQLNVPPPVDGEAPKSSLCFNQSS